MRQSYDLNDNHKNRYFGPRKNAAKLLKQVAEWIEQDDIYVCGLTLNHWYSDEDNAVIYDVTVLHLEGF